VQECQEQDGQPRGSLVMLMDASTSDVYSSNAMGAQQRGAAKEKEPHDGELSFEEHRPASQAMQQAPGGCVNGAPASPRSATEPAATAAAAAGGSGAASASASARSSLQLSDSSCTASLPKLHVMSKRAKRAAEAARSSAAAEGRRVLGWRAGGGLSQTRPGRALQRPGNAGERCNLFPLLTTGQLTPLSAL
jgi:hypothetical protein